MKIFLYGALGSLLPTLSIAYTKQFSAEFLVFNNWQHFVGMLIWAVVAGGVASIYPFRMTKEPRWNALVVGVTLPLIISTLLSIGDRAFNKPDIGLSPRGGVVQNSTTQPKKQQGTLLDLLAIY